MSAKAGELYCNNHYSTVSARAAGGPPEALCLVVFITLSPRVCELASSIEGPGVGLTGEPIGLAMIEKSFPR